MQLIPPTRNEKGEQGIRISIAMATHNGAEYIQEQLESLARQTFSPYELVICDDCSSDETVGIVRQFSAIAAFPVRLYRNERVIGFADNFLRAASLCRGNWIAFCDQDDVWLPHKLASIRDKIIEQAKDDLMLIAHCSLLIAHCSLLIRLTLRTKISK